MRGLGVLPLSLPEGSELFMDSGYTDYAAEDAACEQDSVTFAVQRQRNSRRWDEPWRAYYKQLMRKRIETAFSQTRSDVPAAHSCDQLPWLPVEGLVVRHRLRSGQGVHLATWIN